MRHRQTSSGAGQLAALAGAAALMLALTFFSHGLLLGLSALVIGPLPAAKTALSLSRKQAATSSQPAASADAIEPDAPAQAQPDAAAPADTSYFVALEGDDARPADAGIILEKNYPQGSGEKYIPCGTGTIKNNTRVPAAEVAGGRVMADTLNAAGLNTLHDETLNDYPSYTGSYANSRAVVQQYLAQYPSIKIVLDVHRDAIETENGSRMAPVCTVNGQQAAQVMIICGCDNGGSVCLPNYRQNLRFAAAWERAMESAFPGFTRPVLFSYRFYNQDLTTGSLLIEIGGHGNNLNEALYAGQLAAEGLVEALRNASPAISD